ncbi:molybdenum cofactor biosynthesis protein MoaE [Rhodocyclus purpureus]|uniref:molybdenum cofactor biosynthesis protein MoaE n=1 Tax=Rhodocyclus purpureus TaxID=1067 RepID=UPI001912B555|nr:molybdenum cofactor biosynthesis protein MoaE [Rhodocyclus purpureus]MBK5913647.1 molybdopterin converting factor subunit 2 protein [Rhodocyclus purpureus]
MSGRDYLRISGSPLVAQAAIDFVADPAHGAADLFVGTVRDHNLGKPVRGVSYDVFDGLCLTVFRELAAEVRARWGERLKVYIEHFQGRLDIGGVSILVAVSSPHRDESFKACRYLIEEIKHRAPIWKQEHYVDGDSEWVQGHALCAHGPADETIGL